MSHSVDYLDGMKACKTNSARLEASGRIIINNSNGTDPYGLFLLHIAYEELSKAVFCFFIHKGWFTYDFVKSIFEKHDSKIFILNELLSSFNLVDGVAFLGGKETGDITLEEFAQNHSSDIGTYREDTKNFLYVKPAGNHWHTPAESIKRITQRQKSIEAMISKLHVMLKIIEDNSDQSLLNNFHIIKEGDGTLTFQYDTI